MVVGRSIGASSAVLLLGLAGCAGIGRASPGPLAHAARDSVRAAGLNQEGLALAEQGSFAQAEATFRKSLECDPYFGPSHCNLGVALLKQGKLYDAGWELQFAAKLMPKAAGPRTNLGILFESVHQYAEAETELRSALELIPDDLEVIGQLARLHVRQEKVTAETRGWLQTIASKDDDPIWSCWAIQALIKHRREDAANGDLR